MSQPILVKAYGNIWPAGEKLGGEIARILRQAMPRENAFLETGKGLCRFSFEGIYFPADDVVACIRKHLAPDIEGKLDLLDLENWQLTRFIFANCKIEEKTSPLNNVLDFSGF